MDEILQNKIEGKLLQRAKNFIGMTSVLKDALTAMRIGKIHAMHDATEGGISGALQELALASNIGILVYEEKIPIHEETKAICNFFKKLHYII